MTPSASGSRPVALGPGSQTTPPIADARDPFNRLYLPLLEHIGTPVWILNLDPLRFVWANQSALECWNVQSIEQLQARNLEQELPAAVLRRLQMYGKEFLQGTARFTELWSVQPCSMPKVLRVTLSGMRLPGGRTLVCCEALNEQLLLPESVRSVEALWHTPVMITLYDSKGIPLYQNPAARKAVSDADIPLYQRFATEDAYARFVEALEEQDHERLVTQMQTARGKRWHEITACRCFDPVTGEHALLLSEFDISYLKETEAKADYFTHHDPLTGLPNRTQVNRQFQAHLDDCVARNETAALLFIDLDRFKNVNDSLGHSLGDELLVIVAARLRSALRETEEVARLGGDEFLVMVTLPNNSNETINVIAKRLHDVLSKPISVGGRELTMTFSIGISRFPQDGTDMQTLMQNADLAMYQAKREGRNQSVYFKTQMTTAAQSRMDLETRLRQALEGDDFQLYFQPRLAVRSNKVVGAEALIRWCDREKGLISPAAFIPICEDTGLIVPLSNWVLEAACRQERAWQATGRKLSVSINVSARQFLDKQFLKTTESILAKTGADPRHLELELTESLLVGNDDNTIKTLMALVDMGFRIAIDDFGTGYSNLAYLHRYPISCLKIDRSFISSNDTPRAITEMIIAMGKMLKVTFVAEGVETEEQLAWLRTLECHEYQGYLFSPPVPVAKFEALLDR